MASHLTGGLTSPLNVFAMYSIIRLQKNQSPYTWLSYELLWPDVGFGRRNWRSVFAISLSHGSIGHTDALVYGAAG